MRGRWRGRQERERRREGRREGRKRSEWKVEGKAREFDLLCSSAIMTVLSRVCSDDCGVSKASREHQAPPPATTKQACKNIRENTAISRLDICLGTCVASETHV